jgi:hypothetical protein
VRWDFHYLFKGCLPKNSRAPPQGNIATEKPVFLFVCKFRFIIGGMAKIFISHSSLDQSFAEEVGSRLRVYGHEPKGDIQSLTVTPDWDATLLNALTESDVVVFLFTKTRWDRRTS